MNGQLWHEQVGQYEQWLADQAAQAEYQLWLDTLDTTRTDMRTDEMIESKYLKKEDVGEDGTIVTIRSFDKVNVALPNDAPEYRWTMNFEEFDKPMVLNSTNIKLAERALGSKETDDWIGKKIIVFNDPNVSFGKELVGGIRVRAYRKAEAPRQLPPRQAMAGKQVANTDKLDDDVPF